MQRFSKQYLFGFFALCLGGCSTSLTTQFAPAFSQKDGQFLTTPVPLVNATEDQLQPSVSQTNNQLAYAAQVAGNLDIYLQSSEPGTEPLRLTQHSTDDTSPVFTYDSKQIVWVSKRADVKGDIWIMDADGKNQRKLTSRDTADSTPVCHPNGHHIYFTSRSKTKREPGIRTIDLKSGIEEDLIDHGWDPTISRDGRYMAYVSVEPGEKIPRLYLRDLVEKRAHPITQSMYPEGLPAFITRPDGREELIFVRFVDDINGDGAIDANDTPSLWSIPFKEEVKRRGPPLSPKPLTPVMDGEIFVRPGDAWLVYTASGIGDLDIFALPFDGMLAPDINAGALLQAATTEPQPALRRFMLRHIIATHPELSVKAYRILAKEYSHIGSVDLAIDILNRARGLSQNEIEGWILTIDIAQLQLQKKLGGDTMIRTESLRDEIKLLENEVEPAEQTGVELLKKRTLLFKADIHRLDGETGKAFSIWSALSQDETIERTWQAKSLLGLTKLALELGDLRAAEHLVTQLNHPKFASEPFIRDAAIEAWLDAVIHNDISNPYGELETIIHRHVKHPVIALRAGILQAERQQNENPESAQRRLENLVDTWPNAGMIMQEVLEKLADAAVANQDFEAALKSLDLLLEKFPSHRDSTRKARKIIARIALGEAEAAEKAGNKKLARKLYQRLVKSSRTNATAHRRYITLCSETDDLKTALRHYRQAIRRNPRDRLAHYGLGLVLTYVFPRQLNLAQKQLGKALTLYPRFPEAHLALGWIRMQLERTNPGEGLLEQAIESFQTAKDLVDAEQDPELWGALQLNEGNALMMLGKTDAAFASFLAREETNTPFRNPLREVLYREQFGRAAMHEEVWDVALDMTQTALDLSETLPNQPRRADLRSRLASIQFMLGHYNKAEKIFEQIEREPLSEHPKRKLATLRGLATTRILQGKYREAIAAFQQALRLLERVQDPSLFRTVENGLFVAVVPSNPEDVTAGIRGFGPEQESILTHLGLAALAQEQGRILQAKEYSKFATEMLREKSRDSETGIRIRLELLYALNNLAKLEALSANAIAANAYWKEALQISQQLALPKYGLKILESLQSLSVYSSELKEHETQWVDYAERQLKSAELPEDLQNGFKRFLTLVNTRRALGNIQNPPSDSGLPILDSFIELTGRAEASFKAEEYGREVLSESQHQLLQSLFQGPQENSTTLAAQIQTFIEKPSQYFHAGNKILVQKGFETLSTQQETQTLYELAEKWRLTQLPSIHVIEGSSLSKSGRLKNLRTQTPASQSQIYRALSDKEALLQVVSSEKGPTLWLWHHQSKTLAQKGTTLDSQWFAFNSVQRIYLDITSATEQARASLADVLTQHATVRAIYVPSATWFLFNESTRAIAQGLALTVADQTRQVGMDGQGITINLKDFAEHSSRHPVVNLELAVTQTSPKTPFGHIEVSIGENEESALTLKDLSTLNLGAQIIVVNNVRRSHILREAIATHLQLAGAVAVVFPDHEVNPEVILARLQEANSLGLSDALLSLENIEIFGQPGLEPHEVVSEAVIAFNTAFNKGLKAFKIAQRSRRPTDWARAGVQFETILQTLQVITTKEATAILKDPSQLPALAASPRLKKLAKVLPLQSGKLQLVARDKLSNIRAAQGEHSEAIALRELLTAAYASRGEHLEAAKSLEEQGNVYLSQSNRTKATEAFRECAVFSAMAAIAEQEATCLSKAAKSLERNGRPQEALEDLEKAITLFAAHKSPKEVQARRALGHLYESSLSDYKTAGQLFENALTLAISRQDKEQIHKIKLDQIRLLYTKGDYNAAMSRLTDALDQRNHETPREELTLRLEIAKVAWYQGDYAKARKEQRKALEIALQFGWTFQEIQARSLGGLISMNLGDLDAARISMLDALGLAKRTGRQAEVAIQSNNLGNVLRERGQFKEALFYYRQALEIEDSTRNQEGRAYAIRNMGLTHARMGDPQKARALLQEALKLSQSIGNRYNELQTILALAEVEEQMGTDQAEFSWKIAAHLARNMNLPESLWRSLFGMGRVTKDKAKAELYFEGAILVVESLGGSQSQASTKHSRENLYHQALELAYQDRDESRIFDLSERQKLRALRDKFSVGDTSSERHQNLKKAREVYQEKVFAKIFDMPDVSLNAAQMAYQNARVTFSQGRKGLVKQEVPAPIELDALQSVLPENTAVLVVNTGFPEVWVQFIHGSTVRTTSSLMSHKQIQKSLEELVEAMKNFGPSEASLQKLSAGLLRGAQDWLAPNKHLIFILPEDYTQLPVAALQYRSGALIEHVTVSTNPSATLLFRTLQREKSATPKQVIGIAPARDLPFSKLELAQIQNTEVPEEGLFSQPLQALHLAGHVRNNNRASFELANEGEINSWDILNAEHVPSMVTLSACEGLQKKSFLSLADAFMIRGAHTVVAHPHRVSDLAAAIFMKHFYRNLKRGKAKALQAAALQTRESFPHPAHWAGFQLIGDFR